MSFAERLQGAARRYRLRAYYEHFAPEMSVADVYASLVPGLDIDLLAPDGFQRLWSAHLAATPTALWSVMPAAAPEAVARVKRDECRVLMRSFIVTPDADWHREPFHGIHWPKVQVESCPYTVPGGDLTLLWRWNRMSYLVEHASVYRQTGDATVAANIYALMDSWARANPYLVGANWISPMEPGVRLVAWSMAMAGLTDAAVPDAERCGRLVRSVLHQVQFMAAHFSRWAVPNNHLIGEAALLAAFSAYWPLLEDAPQWMIQAEATLMEEARRQVLKDGFQFENAVNYHMVSLDFFLLYLHAKLIRGETPHDFILEQTRALADAALALVSPSGRMPMIGDDSFTEFTVLAGTMGSPGPVSGKVTFEDFLKLEHARLFATTPWGRDLLALQVPVANARRFHDAGIDVARDETSHIVFTHGPQHRHPYSHGHLHADAASFELELDRTPLIVDSGTYVYDVDPGLRTHMRGAHAHNTAIVDGVEPMKPVAPFEWESVAAAEALGFGVLDDVAVTGCRRQLPARLGPGVGHVRALMRVGSTVIIVDALTPAVGPVGTAPTAALYFHTPVAPGVAALDSKRVRLTDAAQFVRVFEILDEPGAEIDLIERSADPAAQYSTAYGEVSVGTTIRVRVPLPDTVVLVSVVRNPDVSVTRARSRVGEIGCAILEGHTRRIVSLRLDPFAVYVGGRAITGSAASGAAPGASAPDSLEWLDELET